MKELVPSDGTNMAQVFRAISNISPPPDNIFLITDGLPTLGDDGASGATVTARERGELFGDAIGLLSRSIPINIVLYPLEGDPNAPAEFWQLARYTGGAFVAPSVDFQKL